MSLSNYHVVIVSFIALFLTNQRSCTMNDEYFSSPEMRRRGPELPFYADEIVKEIFDSTYQQKRKNLYETLQTLNKKAKGVRGYVCYLTPGAIADVIRQKGMTDQIISGCLDKAIEKNNCFITLTLLHALKKAMNESRFKALIENKKMPHKI